MEHISIVILLFIAVHRALAQGDLQYIARPLGAVLLALQFGLAGFAQSNQTGRPQFSSWGGEVNLSTLNIHLEFPIAQRNGRGQDFNFNLTYDSTIYSLGSNSPNGFIDTFTLPPAPGSFTCLGCPPPPPWLGWGNSLGQNSQFGAGLGGSVSAGSVAPCPTNANATNYGKWGFMDSHGTFHALPSSILVSTDPNCGPAQASGFVTDQTGYFLTVKNDGSGIAKNRFGTTTSTTYSLNPAATISGIIDRNGNVISGDGTNFTDTLGTTALSISNTTDASGNVTSTTYTFPAPGNPTATVVVNFKRYGIASGFGCANLAEYSGGGFFVDNIVLADGTKYLFQYEPTPSTSPAWTAGAITGRLQTLTLPTGATITYGYPAPNGGVSCSDGSLLQLTKTTSDGVWTYKRTVFSTLSSETTTVTDPQVPQGNQTIVSFNALNDTQGIQRGWVEASRYLIDGKTNTGVYNVVTCYNGLKMPNNSCDTPVTMPITETSVYHVLPATATNPVRINELDTFFDPNTAQVTEIDEFDTGSSYTPPLLRKTLTTYAQLGNGISSAPGSVVVCSPGGSDAACNGSGTKVSQTTFGYDEGTLTGASIGAPTHVGISGSRGNLTSTHRWLNTTGATLDTLNTFDDTGNALTTTDPGLHQTSFTYGACNGAFRTQTNLPDTNSPTLAHHTSSATYDCNTGLVSTVTDQNGQVTKFFYDTMFRSTEIDYPDGGQTLSSYPDPNHVTVTQKIDSSHSTSSTTVLDLYGRVSRTAVANGETTPYDQQDSCYDSNGRLSFRSYPYQASSPSAGATCPSTLAGDSFAYDSLGRPTKVTHSDGTSASVSYTGLATQVTDEGNGNFNVSRILQKDGLGRLSGVCELYNGAALQGSGGAPSACNLDIAGTGFLSSYGYDTLGNLTSVAQGAQSRTYAYDSVSRMTSETTPEAGTVSYTYNADSLLATRVRPAANQTSPSVTWTTTYNYDELHRLRSTSYVSSDPTNNPVNTPTANFNYDTDPNWGVPATNIVGRLTEAYTMPYVGGAEIFGYDNMGRVVMNHQWTPVATQPPNAPQFNLDYTYDLIGDMTSYTNGAGVQFTNSYNIAGRLTGIASSLTDTNHPSPLLSNVSYSPTFITSTLGNGIVENTAFSPGGLLQSQQVALPTGQPAAGSVSVAGSLQQSRSITVTIGGQDGQGTTTNGDCGQRRCPPVPFWDVGTISFTITAGGTTIGPVQASYNGSVTTSNIADALFKNFPASPIATMSNPNGSPSFTLTVAGPSPEGASFSSSRQSSCRSSSTQSCPTTGFTVTPQSASFSSGQLNYDSGATTITVNNQTDTYNWSGSTTTAASIAQGVCSVINGDGGSFVSASTNGVAGQCPPGSTTVALVSKTDGASSDYQLVASSSSTWNSFSVSCPGFANCASASLTGGGTPTYSYILGLAPDGQITSANDSVNGNWTFTFDQFNRLTSSNRNSGQQAFTYDYDRYGNRWHQNAPQGGPAPQYSFDTNNHFLGSGVTYDVAGNVLTDGLGNSFTWDAEGRLSKVTQGGTVIATYLYDAVGRRVQGPNGDYLYDLGGNMITQLGLNGAWNFGEIYAGGRHLATYSDGTTNFYHGDWLGTKRVMTAVNGTNSLTCTGFPFGDGVNCTGTNWTYNGFTDDIHDPETNLEHTQFRKYSSTQGRWLTPDPSGMATVELAKPQTWNSYIYVADDPVNKKDKTGLYGDCPFYDQEEGAICFDSDFFESDSMAGGLLDHPLPGGILTVIGNFFGSLFGCSDDDCAILAAAAGWDMDMRFLREFLEGSGGRQIYGPFDPHTLNFQRSISAANILEDLARNCQLQESPTTGREARGLSTGKAATRLLADIWMSPVAAQVGAFDYKWQQQGNTANITITNDATANSLLYHGMSAANTEIQNFANGLEILAGGPPVDLGVRPIPEKWENGLPMSTIHQTFSYSVPNPCSHP
jgi:RHS repeat-associated protein